MKYTMHIFLLVFISLLLIMYGALHAETIKTQGRFLDTASDYVIAVAYVYDGCHHQCSDYCHERKPVYQANRINFWNACKEIQKTASGVHFMVIDASRYRAKNLKNFLSITAPDTFIVFINGYVANLDYLTGCPSEAEIVNYVKKSSGETLLQCQDGNCCPSKPGHSACNTRQSPYGNPSWQVQGYYGGMGGEPPYGYGYTQAGAFSYSMGFRRLPN